jgi:hypothetical protein
VTPWPGEDRATGAPAKRWAGKGAKGPQGRTRRRPRRVLTCKTSQRR